MSEFGLTKDVTRSKGQLRRETLAVKSNKQLASSVAANVPEPREAQNIQGSELSGNMVM